MSTVKHRERHFFDATETDLKLYSLVDVPNITAEFDYVETVLTRYRRFFQARQGMATTYLIEPYTLGTTIRIHEETNEPDNCIWRPFNAEEGVLLDHGKSGVCNREKMIFGREAELLEELGYNVPRWMEMFAWDIGR
jgi:hypothetical protein